VLVAGVPKLVGVLPTELRGVAAVEDDGHVVVYQAVDPLVGG
jgi:hypothetical protein